MLNFDIFCRVVDNYGDIGVCWRLARQLVHDPAVHQVRLWVDDLRSFQRIEPTVSPQLSAQTVANVAIHHWSDSAEHYPPLHEVVIEAFACTLPAAVEAAISPKQLWINLDYLSAEQWINDFHALPSPQGSGRQKYFFFPGFTEQTGGLLREHDLLSRQELYLQQPQQARELWATLGLNDAQQHELLNDERQAVVLFHYPEAPVNALLQTLAAQAEQYLVLSPTQFSATQLAYQNQHLQLHTFDFVQQDEFDHLLWSSTFNLVRGEDSLLRALWAGRPMIWQPYIQDDDLHLEKLDALLDTSPLSASTKALMRSWSTSDGAAFAQQLHHALQAEAWQTWCDEARLWREQLAKQSSLRERLIAFCTEQLRTR